MNLCIYRLLIESDFWKTLETVFKSSKYTQKTSGRTTKNFQRFFGNFPLGGRANKNLSRLPHIHHRYVKMVSK